MSPELDRLAAACLLAAFEGPTAPDWIRSRLADGLGGVVLFARNVESREQLRELTGALRAERADVLVAIDEEGGDVTRLDAATGSSYPGNAALGAVDDVVLTEQVGAAIGGELADVGVNLNFAPVADVNTNPLNPIVGVRAFGSDSQLVARHVAAFVVGTQREGVVACAKHFPGHGDTERDSHLELPMVTRDREGLHEHELPPFRAAIEAGVQSIMTAHIRVPVLDEAPATLSRAVLHELLREELGFQGLVITDALEMRAISATVGIEEGAVRSLDAGADALCIGADVDAALVERIHATITAAVHSGRLPEQRLREAAARVAETAAWAATARVGEAPGPEVGAVAARRALAADGNVELTRPPLVIELTPAPSIAAGRARHGLADSLQPRCSSVETVRLGEAPYDPAGLLDGDRQLILAVRDAHRYGWERELADALLARAGDGVVVETGLPHWRPEAAAGYLATYGSGRANLDAAAALLAP